MIIRVVIGIHTCISQKAKDPVLVYITTVLKKLKKSNDQSENHRFFHTCNSQNIKHLYTIVVLKFLKMSNSWPENHHLFNENHRFFKGFEYKGD